MKYTNQEIAEIAKKYNSKVDFRQHDHKAYRQSIKSGLHEQNCTHMTNLNHNWTYDELKTIALEYNNRNAFNHGNPKAYSAARHKKILDDICSHMIEFYHNWTIDELKQTALKYNRRIDFQKDDGAAYKYAQNRNLIDDICSHMLPVGDRYTRGVYTYRIDFNGEKYAYSGLAYDFNVRHNKHLSAINTKKGNCGVDNFCIKNNIELPDMEITFTYMPIEECMIKEEENKLYLKDQGYIILNIRKCGGVGGTYKIHTNESVAEIAKKYNHRTDFQDYDTGAYIYARKNNIIDDICSHMIKKINYKYTNEDLAKLALNYKYKYDFNKNHSGAYKSASDRGILNQICSHMIDGRKKKRNRKSK